MVSLKFKKFSKDFLLYSKAVLEVLNIGGGIFALSTHIYPDSYYTIEPTLAIGHLWSATGHLWSAIFATLGVNILGHM